jgi:RNA polymerase sigma factor (sigma-70 family)
MNVIVGAAASTEDLVCAAVAGDSSAQQELIQRYSKVVWATVRRFGLRDADAQDAVQNTWVSMIEHLDSLRDPDRLAGWLATTARRECIKISRQSHRYVVGLEHPQLLDLVDEQSPAPERSAVDAAMKDLLWEHVERLPARGKDIVVTLVASGVPRYAEFATATGLPIGSIGPMRMRYLVRLRRGLEDAGLGANAWR